MNQFDIETPSGLAIVVRDEGLGITEIQSLVSAGGTELLYIFTGSKRPGLWRSADVDGLWLCDHDREPGTAPERTARLVFPVGLSYGRVHVETDRYGCYVAVLPPYKWDEAAVLFSTNDYSERP